MAHKITSTIEIVNGRCDMPHHKRRRGAKDHARETITAKGDEPTSQYKSTATSHRNRLFHNVKNANAGITQNVKVEVRVEKEEDCMTSCFGALAACFGRGAKGGS